MGAPVSSKYQRDVARNHRLADFAEAGLDPEARGELHADLRRNHARVELMNRRAQRAFCYRRFVPPRDCLQRRLVLASRAKARPCAKAGGACRFLFRRLSSPAERLTPDGMAVGVSWL